MPKVSKLNYRIFGTGRPVVFLHGFLESLTMWEYLNLKELPIQCICVDLPGHGKSELLDDGIPNISYFASEVEALLHELKIEVYSIVGHSMGGYVGLQLMSNSNKVEKLVLLNSTYWADSEIKKNDRIAVAELVHKSKSLFLKTAIPNLFLNPENHIKEIERLIAEALLQSPGAIAYASLAMRIRADFTDFAMSRKEQISMIQGVDDKVVLKSQIDATNKNNLKVFYIDDCGHMAHIEKSAEVIHALSIVLQ